MVAGQVKVMPCTACMNMHQTEQNTVYICRTLHKRLPLCMVTGLLHASQGEKVYCRTLYEESATITYFHTCTSYQVTNFQQETSDLK